MKNVFELVKDFVETKLELSNRKKKLRTQVVRTGESLLVNVVIPTVGKLVRSFIVERGLNPDYVPPPASKPETPLWEPKKDRPSFRFGTPSVPSWVKDSFKNISNHPIIQSRNELYRTGLKHEVPPDENTSPLQVAASSIKQRVAASMDETGCVKTEVLPNAIEDLRKALYLIKNNDKVLAPTIFPAKKSFKKKSSKKSTKKPVKKSAKVTKNFNGTFRRVSEE